MRNIAFTLLFSPMILLVNSSNSFAQVQDSKPDSRSDSVPDQNVTKNVSDSNLFWIFLTTGKSTDGVDKDEVLKMQSDHLANFKRLAGEEKLLLAGPLTDPEKKLRGIVVVKAKSKSELAEMFKPDPYVQNGYLKIEATEMEFEFGTINTQITPQGLDEFRLVLFENMSEKDSELGTASVDTKKFIAKMSSDKELLFTAFLPKADCSRAALMIMAKTDDEQKITEKVQEIPAVKSGAWKSRVIPLFVGKGVLSSP